MTINQRLIWTALPNGITPDNLNYKLSVFVSPRLFTDEGSASERLSSFPDFLDWPATPITFSVHLASKSPTVTVTSPAPNRTLWKTLFHPTTFVEPYVYTSIADQNFHSYPTNFLRDWFVSTYATLFNANPTEYPSLSDLGLGPGGAQGPYSQLPINPAAAIREINDQLAQGVSPPAGGPAVHAIGPAASANPPTDFEQARALPPTSHDHAAHLQPEGSPRQAFDRLPQDGLAARSVPVVAPALRARLRLRGPDPERIVGPRDRERDADVDPCSCRHDECGAGDVCGSGHVSPVSAGHQPGDRRGPAPDERLGPFAALAARLSPAQGSRSTGRR